MQRVAAVFVGVLLLLTWVVLNGVSAAYSQSNAHESSAKAKTAGVFVQSVAIRDSSVTGPNATFRVLDAWIEEETHRETVALLFFRTIRDERYRMVVATETIPNFSAEYRVGVVMPDQRRLGVEDTISEHAAWVRMRPIGSTLERQVREPFPAYIRVVVFKANEPPRDTTTKFDAKAVRRVVGVVPENVVRGPPR